MGEEAQRRSNDTLARSPSQRRLNLSDARELKRIDRNLGKSSGSMKDYLARAEAGELSIRQYGAQAKIA